jgi:hypothetical protein
LATYQTRDIRLQDVVGEIADGVIRLPEFQRNFTWALSDQRALLDSVQKNYPVGTLLLLEVGDENAVTAFGQRKFSGAPDPVKNTELLVLDGQQRLSSCYRAFASTGTSIFCINLAALFERTEGKPRQAIDLGDLIVLRPRPVHVQNLLYNKDLLPFEYLRDRDDLRQRLAQYRTNLLAKPETQAFGNFVDVYLEGYVDVFFDYRFPAVILPATLDIEAVANVFTKINTTGLKLSAFDLCVATLYPKGVKLRGLLAEAHELDGVRALDQDGTNLLQTVALIAGKAPKKAALVKNITKPLIDAHWNAAVAAMNRASKVLASVGAPDSSLIPYDAMVPALSAAMAATPAPTNPAEREGERLKLSRWVQQTAFLQRYNEGTDVKQAADFPVAVTWFSGGAEPAFLADTIVWQESWNRVPRAGARYRAFVALLNEIGPRDLIETTKHLGRGLPDRHSAQLHHVFPRAYLRDAGYELVDIEVTLNITFLTAESNNFISNRAPSLYLADRINALVSGGATRAAALTSLKTLLGEHLIDDAGWDAMLRDDYEAFLAARSAALRDRLGQLGINVVYAPTEEVDSANAGDEAALADELVDTEEAVEA